MATGFQVVAQMSNFSEVHKIYTGKASGRQDSVAVRVGDNGEYQVSVLAVRGETGILNSNVEYQGRITVMELAGTCNETFLISRDPYIEETSPSTP